MYISCLYTICVYIMLPHSEPDTNNHLKTPRCVCILHCTNRAVAQWVCHWPTCPGQVTCDDWHFGKRDDMKVAIILILKKVNICWCQNRWTSKIWSIYISIIYSNKSMRYCRQGSLIWKEKPMMNTQLLSCRKRPVEGVMPAQGQKRTSKANLFLQDFLKIWKDPLMSMI